MVMSKGLCGSWLPTSRYFSLIWFSIFFSFIFYFSFFVLTWWFAISPLKNLENPARTYFDSSLKVFQSTTLQLPHNTFPSLLWLCEPKMPLSLPYGTHTSKTLHCWVCNQSSILLIPCDCNGFPIIPVFWTWLINPDFSGLVAAIGIKSLSVFSSETQYSPCLITHWSNQTPNPYIILCFILKAHCSLVITVPVLAFKTPESHHWYSHL